MEAQPGPGKLPGAALRHWVNSNTFTPPWLTHPWSRHPGVGYLVAVLLQVLAASVNLVINDLFPPLTFPSALPLLLVAFVALIWGAGPSLLATLVGTILLYYTVLPPQFTFVMPTLSQVVSTVWLLMVGVTTTVAGSRAERLRREAQALAASLAEERGRLVRAQAEVTARAQESAAMEERARLARELHDSVTQSLFSTMLHARAAQMALQRMDLDRSGALGRSIAQVSELTRGALAEMRVLIFELRPDALAEEGLVAALRKHADALHARVGLIVEVEAPAERLPLADTTEEHLYRLALEALHNVVKHARANYAWVRLELDHSGALTLDITDDGVGFDPAIVQPGHLGLGTMAERAARAGGGAEIRTAPGCGTTVRVAIPRALLETPLEPATSTATTERPVADVQPCVVKHVDRD